MSLSRIPAFLNKKARLARLRRSGRLPLSYPRIFPSLLIDSHGISKACGPRPSINSGLAGLSPWSSLSSLRGDESEASPTTGSRGPRSLEIE